MLVTFLIEVFLGCQVYAQVALNAAQINQAREWARLCGVSYCPGARVKTWKCDRCLNKHITDVKTFQSDAGGSQFGYFAANSNEKAIMLVFRATDDTDDWLKNFDIDLVPYITASGSKISDQHLVHDGFQTGWQNIKDTIVRLLGVYFKKYPNYRLICLGHSLGGAYATFASLIAREKHPYKYVLLRTFGAPRMMNSKMVAYFKTRRINALRYTNYYDLIPHVPIETRYSHHMQEICTYDRRHLLCGNNFDDRTGSPNYCSNTQFNVFPTNGDSGSYTFIVAGVATGLYNLEVNHGFYYGLDIRGVCTK